VVANLGTMNFTAPIKLRHKCFLSVLSMLINFQEAHAYPLQTRYESSQRVVHQLSGSGNVIGTELLLFIENK